MTIETLATLFAWANVLVGLGYLTIALAIAPHFVVRSGATRVAAIAFFLTSSWTHAEIARASFAGEVAVETPYHYAMLVLQAVQAMAVWLFVVALWVETRTPTGDE
jgi:hypothetical protein